MQVSAAIVKSSGKHERDWLEIILASDGNPTNIAPTCAATTWAKCLRAFRPLGMTYQVSRLPFAALLDEAGILRARGWSIRASTWKACSKRSAWESLLFRIISPTPRSSS